MAGSLPSNLYVGTQSWSCRDWVGVLYPEQTKPADYIAEYAKHYAAVEVDSTFYRIPSKRTVAAWNERTPDDFVFTAKIPQVITHENFLQDCQNELKIFLKMMDILGDKLGALLFQFRYYRKAEIASGDDFLEQLAPFLKKLPDGYRFALEVRNKAWVNEEFLDLLRKHKIAFALTDHPWMENVAHLIERIEVITSDFCYVRWLGDRKKIEEETKRWDSIIIDRRREMKQWIPVIKKLMAGDIGDIYAFFNNHYAGYAPGSIDLFKEMWQRKDTSK